MIRQFVHAEFYTSIHLLKQFEYAMQYIRTQPDFALLFLTDTDYDRWKTICSEIKNIDDVVEAIEFLGDSLDTKKGCCSPQHRKIENAIQVAKLAALPRREAQAVSHIGELEHDISKLKQTQSVMKGFIQRLNNIIEPIRKKLRKKPQGSEEEATRVNRMMRQIIKMENSRRETAKKIETLTTKLNIWKRHMATIRPYPGNV